ELRAQGEAEKAAIEKPRALRKRIEETKAEIEKGMRVGDLSRAAELQYGTLASLERELKQLEAKGQRAGGARSRAPELQSGPLASLERELKELEAKGQGAGGRRLIKEEVDEEDIAEVVSRWTGIPLSKLMEGEMQKLLRLPEELHHRVVGQDEAVSAVADAVVRARAGIKDPKRPIGSFPFLAPPPARQNELA